MTLPVEKDDQIYSDRPGDQLFAKVKHQLPKILERSALVKDLLLDIIISDLVLDHALSNALDDVGAIIEYQAQSEGVEKPKFNGLSILKDAERVGKLNFIVSLCSVLGFDGDTTEAVRNAEIARIWGGEVTKPKKEGSSSNTLKLSDEVTSILKDLARVSKKGK
jgi:hypothetical protein